MSIIRVFKKDLEKCVQDGFKHKDIAEKFGIPVTRAKALCKEAGLRIKPTRKGNIVQLVEDDNTPIENDTTEKEKNVTETTPATVEGNW